MPQNRFRPLKRIFLIFVVIIVSDILFSLVYVGLANHDVRVNQDRQTDAVIVLFHAFKGNAGLSDETIRRCQYARNLLLKNRVSTIVCSGGLRQGRKGLGAVFMGQWLSDRGVSNHNIIIEANSCDTLANIRNSRELLGRRGYRSAFVVSSALHLRRLSYMLSKETVSRDVTLYMAPYPRRPARPKPIWLSDVLQANYEWVSYGLYFLLPRTIYNRIIYFLRDCFR